jgi:hypothetical protein
VTRVLQEHEDNFFLGSKDVKWQYQPSKPTAETPYFEIKVFERQPRLMALLAEVYGGCLIDPAQLNLFHGLWGTLFKIPGDKDLYVTVSGLVIIGTTRGSKKFY